MQKNDRPMKEKPRTARIAGYAILATLLLITLSATALAGARRPIYGSSAARNVETQEPTKSPTFQRPTLRSATPVSESQARVLSAPSTIPGQTQFDANTVALYHFDSQVGNLVPDAGGQYTGTLHGNAAVYNPSLYGGGLQLDGNGSYVTVSNLPALPQGTIEAFVDFQSVCDTRGYFGYPLFSFGGDYGSNQSVAEVRVEGYLHFQMFTPPGQLTSNGWLTSTSGITACRYLAAGTDIEGVYAWPYSVWRYHHIAATWGPRGMETWVDGVLHGEATKFTWQSTNPPIYNITYACNPQLQVDNNPSYPQCPTPVLLQPATPPATPGNAPPGDYFGPLPAFTTLLIGCDARQVCSRGHIDEVRISNIQRTFSPSVDPTSTPTPTQTPDVISGAYTVDANTKELYHFDDSSNPWAFLESVSGVYSANKENITAGVPGRFNTGVGLNGTDSYVLLHKLSNTYQGVMEAWVNLSSPTRVNVIHGGSGYKGVQIFSNFRLGVDPSHSNTFVFAVKESNWNYADSMVNPSALVGSWHHVAGTWGPRGLEIWIDGQLCGTDVFYTGHSLHVDDNYLVGCDSSGNCMQGTVDEVRFSDIQRSFVFASGPFAPSRRAAPAATPLPFELFLPFAASGGSSGISSVPCGVSAAGPVAIKSIP